MNRLFAGCAADPACDAAYPDLEATFYALVHQLDDSPVTLRPVDAGTGEPFDVVLTGDRLLYAIEQALYRTDFIPLLPLVITDTAAGNYALLTIGYASSFSQGLNSAWGMHYSVRCGEEVPFLTQEVVAQAIEGVRPEIRDVGLALVTQFNLDACEFWGVPPPTAIENDAVVSDIPTLILAGEYDRLRRPTTVRRPRRRCPEAISSSSAASATESCAPSRQRPPVPAAPCSWSARFSMTPWRTPMAAASTTCRRRASQTRCPASRCAAGLNRCSDRGGSHMHHSHFMGTLLAAFLAPTIVWAALTPVGREFRVNTTRSDFESPAVAVDAQGGAVVVWANLLDYNDENLDGVFGQRFDSAGAALGTEFRVSSDAITAGPTVAMAPSGDFVVVWGSDGRVLGRHYDGTGAALGGQFEVLSDNDVSSTPAVAIDSTGGFIVVWEGYELISPTEREPVRVFAQRHDQAGNVLGAAIQVNDDPVNVRGVATYYRGPARWLRHHVATGRTRRR